MSIPRHVPNGSVVYVVQTWMGKRNKVVDFLGYCLRGCSECAAAVRPTLPTLFRRVRAKVGMMAKVGVRVVYGGSAGPYLDGGCVGR